MGRTDGKSRVACVLACFALAILAQFAGPAAAQDLQPPVAAREGLQPLEKVAQWSAPPVDVKGLLLEDEANRARQEIPYRIGFPMETDLSPANSGTWEMLPSGDSVWRLKVRSEEALWVVLGFGVFQLQAGGEMTVYDAQRRTVKGPYTSEDIRKHGELWFPPIAGDTLVVELFWPDALYAEQPDIHLTTVSHGYKPFGPIGRKVDDPGDDVGIRIPGSAGDCNIDTSCPEADEWQDEKRGAVMVLVGGSGNCSGALINTTANDCRTYLLTAAHCGEDGPSTTIGFNYECPTCGCTTDPGTINDQTLTGGTLLGNYATSDFTLIAMDEDPPEAWGAYYIGWSRDPNPALNTHVIHYPRGDVRKIAYDADPPVDGHNYGSHHWRIADPEDGVTDPAHQGYELGTTEPASSGSPLMDHNHRIVGQLHGGTASCTSDTWDEYGKIDASWVGGGTPETRLSDWLDPLGTGAIFVDGIDHSVCLYQPAGSVQFTRELYSCDDTLIITLRDDNIPGNPATLNVAVSSATEITPETVTLDKINPDIGSYTGSIPTSSVPPVHGDGLLSVGHGDILTVNYVDADDGSGGFDITIKDNADADCAPPVISNVQSALITGTVAAVTWVTDELADSLVTYGLTPPGSLTEGETELVAAHEVLLRGLVECSPYLFSVASADVVGNAAADDNGGDYYGFETGRNTETDYPSTDTPMAIVDSGTINSVISVPDNKAVLGIRVELNITHTYDGDLDITLINPFGTRVLLVADRGGTGENFTATLFDDEAAISIVDGAPPFTGSFQPEEPLAGAAGTLGLGDWTLEVIDDAGSDTGTLESWTLTLLYPPGMCGPSANYGYHAVELDECPVGAGDGNGYWDAGEQIQFSLTVENDGTDPLSAVTARVIPRTEGVIMIDPLADFGDIAEDTSAVSLSPHYTALLPTDLVCGADLAFDVVIDANEGSWVKSFTQINGEVIPGGPVVAWSEDFEAAGIPLDWTIVDGLSDGYTWYTDNAGDPAGCANTDPNPPLAGNWAAVDSDCAGSGVAMDEELITPVIDMTGISGATLEFDHYFNWLGPETADVDVRSSLTGGAWVNVARWVADTANPEHVAIEIGAHADGVSDLQIRWHYYDADYEWYWYVDNVTITHPSAADCVMPECLVSPTGPPPVPDGSAGGSPLIVDRLLPDGSSLQLTWDDQCAPVNANIIYGPLDQVSAYTVSGGECAIANPAIWDPAPGGSVWFLVVSDDGAGAESSWGLVLGAERNGMVHSGTCGVSSKVLTGTCP